MTAEQWCYDVPLQTELGLIAGLFRVLAMILSWFCLYVLDALLIKNTRESSPFFTSGTQPSCPETEVATVGEGKSWCPRVLSEMEQGGNNVPKEGSLVWGARAQQGQRGASPGKQRSCMKCWSPSKKKKGSTWESRGERLLTYRGIYGISKSIKDQGSQVSHCQKREVQIEREKKT